MRSINAGPLFRVGALSLSTVILCSSVLSPWSEANLWDSRRRYLDDKKNPLYARSQNALSSEAPSLDRVLHDLPAPAPQPIAPAGFLRSSTFDDDPSAVPADDRLRRIAQAGNGRVYIREIHRSPRPEAPLIVHIQDAHEVSSAQTHIAQTIAELGETSGTRLIGVEGAQGSFQTAPYRSYPDAATTRSLADFFMAKGFIGAPEYAGITSPTEPLLWGVETQPVYEDNIRAYRQSESLRGALRARTTPLRTALNSLRSTLFPKELLEFHLARELFLTEDGHLNEFVRLLQSHKTDWSSYPQLTLYRQALSIEQSLDFRAVEKERARLLEELVDRLPPEGLNRLLQTSLDYRLGKISYSRFHDHLKELCLARQIDLAPYARFSHYLRYLHLAEKIRRESLWEEIQLCGWDVQDHLASTPDQKKLLETAEDLRLLERCVDHKLTPPDWTAYSRRNISPASIAQNLSQTALDRRIPLNLPDNTAGTPSLTPFEDFYRLAEKRNGLLVDNLLAKMKAESAPSAILVAGGFHTDGLAEQMRRRDVSYIVMCPRLTDAPGPTDALAAFTRAPTPLEKLFTGQTISLAATPLLSDSALSLKAYDARKEVSALESAYGTFQALLQQTDKKILAAELESKANAFRTVDGLRFSRTPLRNRLFFALGFQKDGARGTVVAFDPDDATEAERDLSAKGLTPDRVVLAGETVWDGKPLLLRVYDTWTKNPVRLWAESVLLRLRTTLTRTATAPQPVPLPDKGMIALAADGERGSRSALFAARDEGKRLLKILVDPTDDWHDQLTRKGIPSTVDFVVLTRDDDRTLLNAVRMALSGALLVAPEKLKARLETKIRALNATSLSDIRHFVYFIDDFSDRYFQTTPDSFHIPGGLHIAFSEGRQKDTYSVRVSLNDGEDRYDFDYIPSRTRLPRARPSPVGKTVIDGSSPVDSILLDYVLSSASVQEREQFAALTTRWNKIPLRDIPAGNVLIRKGERIPHAFFIRRGTVRIIDEDTGTVLAVRGPGEIIGESSFFDGDSPANATVRALTDVSVSPLRREDVPENIRSLMKNAWRHTADIYRMDLFKGLPRRIQKLIASLVEEKTIVAGDRPAEFISEGDEGDTVFLIAEGTVDVFKKKDGVEQLIDRRVEGESIGEMSSFENRYRRNATCRVPTGQRARLLTMKSADFERIAKRYPFVKYIAELILKDRIHSTLKRTAALGDIRYIFTQLDGLKIMMPGELTVNEEFIAFVPGLHAESTWFFYDKWNLSQTADPTGFDEALRNFLERKRREGASPDELETLRARLEKLDGLRDTIQGQLQGSRILTLCLYSSILKAEKDPHDVDVIVVTDDSDLKEARIQPPLKLDIPGLPRKLDCIVVGQDYLRTRQERVNSVQFAWYLGRMVWGRDIFDGVSQPSPANALMWAKIFLDKTFLALMSKTESMDFPKVQDRIDSILSVLIDNGVMTDAERERFRTSASRHVEKQDAEKLITDTYALLNGLHRDLIAGRAPSPTDDLDDGEGSPATARAPSRLALFWSNLFRTLRKNRILAKVIPADWVTVPIARPETRSEPDVRTTRIPLGLQIQQWVSERPVRPVLQDIAEHELDIRSLVQTALTSKSRHSRERRALADFLSQTAGPEDIFGQVAERHKRGLSVTPEGAANDIRLAALAAATGLLDKTSSSTEEQLRRRIEEGTKRYNDVMGLESASERLEADIRSRKETGIEISKTLLDGTGLLTEIDRGIIARIQQLVRAAREGRIERFSLLLPEGASAHDATVISQIARWVPEWTQGDRIPASLIRRDSLYGSDQKLSVIKLRDLLGLQKNVPLDIFILDRNEWNDDGVKEGLVNLLVMLTGDLIVNATQKLDESLKALHFIKIQA